MLYTISMSRAIVLSNSELVVALDDRAQVRDIYYPHVGLEDHVRGHYLHRVGVWVEGRLSWLSDPAWEVRVECEEDALVSKVTAKHAGFQVELIMHDVVYNERAIFLRSVEVKNAVERTREIKLYFAQQFEIAKMHGGDTAYYDPECHAIIHYKGRRVFLIGATINGAPFQDFACGLSGFQGHEGTHKDAEDGKLGKNPIEHGPADSAVGLYGTYTGGETKQVEYWLAAAETIPDAHELNTYVLQKTPAHLLESARGFWGAWVGAYEWHFDGLTKDQVVLFKKSLMYIRAHVDHGGGILASLDSDMLNYGLDTYTYIWPRDAAYSALALDRSGDAAVSRRFFMFCKEVIRKEGYFMHKYLPDRSLGSSWHPWVRNGHSELPIQEDETALVLYALGEHYIHSRDVEFLEEVYGALVEAPANFMLEYRDPTTKLPLASYDLWEEKRGSHTFSCASVYGALLAAERLSKVLGKKDQEARYRNGAQEVRQAILAHLWDEKEGYFYKSVDLEGGTMTIDRTIDMSSGYGVFSFGVLPPNDSKLARAFEKSVRALSYGAEAGGLARYEGDKYYLERTDVAGNPWFTTTLWYAEYLIAIASSANELVRAKDIFAWTAKYALVSGVLSEQIDPKTGAQISAAPLCWSHAAYVNAVTLYLTKLEELGLCVGCNPAP